MQDAVDAVFRPHCVVFQLLNVHSLCSSDDAVCSRLGFASIALPCNCKTVLILTFYISAGAAWAGTLLFASASVLLRLQLA